MPLPQCINHNGHGTKLKHTFVDRSPLGATGQREDGHEQEEQLRDGHFAERLLAGVCSLMARLSTTGSAALCLASAARSTCIRVRGYRGRGWFGMNAFRTTAFIMNACSGSLKLMW